VTVLVDPWGMRMVVPITDYYLCADHRSAMLVQIRVVHLMCVVWCVGHLCQVE